MVKSRRQFDRMGAFDRIAPLMPILSALVVLALGFGLTWGAYVRAKDSFNFAGSGRGLINEAQVLYLQEGQDQLKQLFVTGLQEKNPEALTEASGNVTDYALSPDQTQVLVVQQTDDLSNEIWLSNYLKRCSEPICETRAERKRIEEVRDSFLLSSRNGSTDLDIWITMLMFFPQPTDEQGTFFTLAQLLFPNAANVARVVVLFYRRLTCGIVIALIQAQILWLRLGRLGSIYYNGFDRFIQQFRIMNIGSRQHDRKRTALSIRQNALFRTVFASIGGVGADFISTQARLAHGPIRRLPIPVHQT
jgi:hypothetical protein